MPLLSLADLNTFNDDQDPKHNEEQLNLLGGLNSLEKKLNTNFLKGLKGDEQSYENRREIYGTNELPAPVSQTWIGMFLESFEDATLIVLIVAAVVSLIVGIYEDPINGWIEGGAILFAVLLVAVVTATNNFNKEAQFRKLNAVKDDTNVTVIRDSESIDINVKKLVVGDIVLLNAGDKIPADGVLVGGSDVVCNESALTGESDNKKKLIKPVSEGGDIFLLSGAIVTAGYCHMLVTAVGENSRWGKTKAKLAVESEDTPLQDKLNILAGQIGNLGMGAAVCTFIAMIAIWYLYPESRADNPILYKYVLKAFIMGVTIVVVAVPEGLPLAVTLSLAYSTQKMMHDNNLIREIAACETMGNATNICSDKTGTLTQNRMTVVEAWCGGEYFSKSPPQSSALPATLVQALSENISINSTAILIKPETAGATPTVSGSNTEGALLMMLASHYAIDYTKVRNLFDSTRGDKLFTFSSARKCMSALIMSPTNGTSNGTAKSNKEKKSGRLYTKGAAEIVVESCDSYIDLSGKVIKFTEAAKRDLVENVIQKMAQNALRAVALAHKEIDKVTGNESPDSGLETSGLTLDMIVGIKDPLRPDVTEAVKICQEAGIFVRMVTGDNLETAKAIAKECGILTPGGIAIEGPDFRKLTPKQLDDILPTLQVVARSSPTDKYYLVCRLNGHKLPENQQEWEAMHPGLNYKKMKDLVLPGYAEEWNASRESLGGGEVVGVTGDGTNDGPALKAADVGLAMGITGTDVAKEASDIIIMDDNFSSIVKAVMWGRSVFDNIRKFLQFQLTVNIVALTLTFVSAITGLSPPLNAVMMLWVNMIMDTMGALALGTEPPSLTLLDRKPYKRNASLINNKMLRNILCQFLFQIGLLTYLLRLGYEDFGTVYGSREHFTVIFNAFVFCQIFNELNARSIGNNPNIFKGLSENPLFIGIVLFTCVAQYFLIQYGGDFVKTTPLNADQWVKCVVLGALSLPLGGLMRLIPVKERDSDFAQISPLITKTLARKTNSVKSANLEAMRHASPYTASYFLWLAVVLAVPMIAYSKFEANIAHHLNQFKSVV